MQLLATKEIMSRHTVGLSPTTVSPSILWKTGAGHACGPLGMAERLSTATRSCHARLRVVPRQLLQALARRKRVYISAHTPRAPRPASAYTMLVESDVQHGMRGILPSCPHSFALYATLALKVSALPTDKTRC